MSGAVKQADGRHIAITQIDCETVILRPAGRTNLAGGFSHRTSSPNYLFARQGERTVTFARDSMVALRAPIRANLFVGFDRWLKPPAKIARPPGEDSRETTSIASRSSHCSRSTDRTFMHFATAIIAVCISTAAFAQSTQPAGRFDDQPVRTSRAETAGPTTRSAVNQLPVVKFDWPRVALALGGVIAIIFTMRWGAKKFLGVAAATGAGKIVRVLGRATVGPRQQIVLLQIGRRVIIAADNAGQLTSLTQVTDADEVAALLGQFEETNTAAPTGLFKKWFNKAEDDFESPDPEDQLALAGAPKLSLSQPTEDSSLQSARGEIASLMDKARDMARQIRRNG